MGSGLGMGWLGGMVGFGVGFAWASRALTAKMAFEARRRVGRVRDEHWLQQHPIDYA